MTNITANKHLHEIETQAAREVTAEIDALEIQIDNHPSQSFGGIHWMNMTPEQRKLREEFWALCGEAEDAKERLVNVDHRSLLSVIDELQAENEHLRGLLVRVLYSNRISVSSTLYSDIRAAVDGNYPTPTPDDEVAS